MKTTFALITLFLALAAAASVATSLATNAPFNPMLAVALLSSFASAGLIAIISVDYSPPTTLSAERVRKPVAKPEAVTDAIDPATCHTISA